MKRILAGVFLFAACGGGEVVVRKPAPPPPPAAPARVALDAVGVDVVMPDGAWLGPTAADRQDVYLSPRCPDPGGDALAPSFCVSATFERVAGAAPTLDAARAAWDARTQGHDADGDRAPKTLAEGTAPGGVMFTVRTFSVRVGFSSVGGIVHTFRPIARVLAILPVDASHHVACTGYVEHAVTSAADAAIAPALAVCTSMRATATPSFLVGFTPDGRLAGFYTDRDASVR